MMVAGHQSHYLPGMRFFAKMLACDKFILVDHLQFVKKEWQNRNKIRTKDGTMWLTVPIISKGKMQQKISDVEIDNNIDWQRVHWRALEFNYCKAQYFDEYKQFFQDVYEKKWTKLVDANSAIIKFLVDELKIDKEIVLSSDLGLKGKGTDLLIEMCRKFNADTYLSGQAAKNYLELEKFKENKLNHAFINFQYTTYPQQFSPFIPNLSIIDTLFNCGKEETRRLLGDNIRFER